MKNCASSSIHVQFSLTAVLVLAELHRFLHRCHVWTRADPTLSQLPRDVCVVCVCVCVCCVCEREGERERERERERALDVCETEKEIIPSMSLCSRNQR